MSIMIKTNGITKKEWSDTIMLFEDSSIYQTWEYGDTKWGEKNLRHLIVYKNEELIAAVQIRLIKLFPFNRGIAYIYRGPFWRPKNKVKNTENLKIILSEIRKEYSFKQKYYVKIVPNEICENDNKIDNIFINEGFFHSKSSLGTRTILVYLNKSVEELRDGLRRKWRQTLGYAEKFGLKINIDNNDCLIEKAIKLYSEMHGRKQFTEFVDMKDIKSMQLMLPDELKMKIAICYLKGIPIATLAWSTIGKRGLPMLNALGNKGLKTNAAYLLWWEMIKWYKNNNFEECDLGGINPEKNKGGYVFKTGLSKNNGSEVFYLNHFETWDSSISRLIGYLAEKTIQLRRAMKVKIDELVRNRTT